VRLAASNGLSAKLTGAGIGGKVIVCGPELEKKQELFHDYKYFMTVLGDEGFREEL
jgi:mevalonate kinase